MLRYFLFLALMIATAASAEAPKSDIRPGLYIRDGDSGTLIIRSSKVNRLAFEIESIGGNCHSCSITGVIVGNIGHGDSCAADESDSKCRISFSADQTTVAVAPITEEECRAYCGMRAGFDGIYRIPPGICTSASRQKLRDKFVRLYRSRRFSEAAETMQSLLDHCRGFIGWIEADQVRNDLALAQYHNGDIQQCLATLNTTLAAQVRDEEELKAGAGNVYLPPCDFDNYIQVAKSTWFNKALCTRAVSKER